MWLINNSIYIFDKEDIHQELYTNKNKDCTHLYFSSPFDKNIEKYKVCEIGDFNPLYNHTYQEIKKFIYPFIYTSDIKYNIIKILTVLSYIYLFYMSFVYNTNIWISILCSYLLGINYILMIFQLLGDPITYKFINKQRKYRIVLMYILLSLGIKSIKSYTTFSNQNTLKPIKLCSNLQPAILEYIKTKNISDKTKKIISYIFPGSYVFSEIFEKKFRRTKCEFMFTSIFLLYVILKIKWMQIFIYFIGINYYYMNYITSVYGTPESAFLRHHMPIKDMAFETIISYSNVNTHNNLYSMLMGYMNYKIEHILFPLIPYTRLPEVSKKISQYCLNKNIPYLSFKKTTIFTKIIQHIHR